MFKFLSVVDSKSKDKLREVEREVRRIEKKKYWEGKKK